MDWMLPFREMDNAAWGRASTLGRVFFPAYIFLAALRTLVFWGLMLGATPAILMVSFSESSFVRSIESKIEKMFTKLFCKPA